MIGTKGDGVRAEPRRQVEGVAPGDRTKVIIMSQLVAIVALIVLWAILRARRTDPQVLA